MDTKAGAGESENEGKDIRHKALKNYYYIHSVVRFRRREMEIGLEKGILEDSNNRRDGNY